MIIIDDVLKTKIFGCAQGPRNAWEESIISLDVWEVEAIALGDCRGLAWGYVL